MADARTLADAIIRRLEMPVIPPSYSSSDGLPANEQALEEADDALIEAMAINSGRVSVDDLIRELTDLRDAGERMYEQGAWWKRTDPMAGTGGGA